ncbi:MAG: HDOD domain-containing protein [Gammaproteobacteria bacterium]|nr:HDOD domain-containing protein [Gammaproteobacteria bacterium]
MYQRILKEKRSKIRDLPDLPPFPAIAQKIMAQVSNEHVDIPKLAKTIEQDPAVFGRIIGVANSAYFGCPDQIYTISHAIVRVLGLCMVKSLALGMVLNEPFKVEACPNFNMEKYWFDSLLTAQIAQRLSRYIQTDQSDFQDRAYLAGMLNNLGDLVLTYLYPSEMNDVLRQVKENPELDKQDSQSEIIGINSYEASAILSKRWHLPIDLQIMFNQYHKPDYDGEHWQLLHLVRLSHHLALHGGDGSLSDHLNIQFSLDKLGLTIGQINKLQQKLSTDRQDIENLSCIMAIA